MSRNLGFRLGGIRKGGTAMDINVGGRRVNSPFSIRDAFIPASAFIALHQHFAPPGLSAAYFGGACCLRRWSIIQTVSSYGAIIIIRVNPFFPHNPCSMILFFLRSSARELFAFSHAPILHSSFSIRDEFIPANAFIALHQHFAPPGLPATFFGGA
jgi:hypothetical protein